MTTCRHGFHAGHCTVPTCAHILPPAEEWRSCDGCFSMFRPWADEHTCSEDCRITVAGRAKRGPAPWEVYMAAREAHAEAENARARAKRAAARAAREAATLDA